MPSVWGFFFFFRLRLCGFRQSSVGAESCGGTKDQRSSSSDGQGATTTYRFLLSCLIYISVTAYLQERQGAGHGRSYTRLLSYMQLVHQGAAFRDASPTLQKGKGGKRSASQPKCISLERSSKWKRAREWICFAKHWREKRNNCVINY